MAYATISDLREAGFGMDAEESRLALLLDQASALIDEWTGQWFEAREATLRLDGSGTPSLELPMPPIRVDEVQVDGVTWPITLYTVVDDPNDPLLYCPSRWPPGKRNVDVRGAFGRLENGTTPKLITVACVRLAARLLMLDGDLDAGRRISQESENGTQVIYEHDDRPAPWWRPGNRRDHCPLCPPARSGGDLMDGRFFVEVGFRRLDQERTQIDPDFHVPVNGQAYGLLEICRGIVRWQTFDRQATRDGAASVLRGVLSVPVASDPELKPGDQVERVAGNDLQPPVYVISVYTATIRGKPAWVRYELASREVA